MGYTIALQAENNNTLHLSIQLEELRRDELFRFQEDTEEVGILGIIHSSFSFMSSTDTTK